MLMEPEAAGGGSGGQVGMCFIVTVSANLLTRQLAAGLQPHPELVLGQCYVCLAGSVMGGGGGGGGGGLQVKADYVPLLQSLATFGWRLTCVLPTPVIKTNR
ncbi:Raftlin [Liparis tanakae]|uniref:Raftlin n=1 Tax=Liparis tanakae TaxID=230148 RepID=A0A4Z2EYI6_9TELE|nr:Raftlin [Liparis tanakae]